MSHYFDGSSAFALPDIDVADGDFTLVCRMYHNATPGTNGAVSYDNHTSTPRRAMGLMSYHPSSTGENGGFGFVNNTGSGLYSGSAASTGQWYNMVLAYDDSANQFEVFEDGVSLGTFAAGDEAPIAMRNGRIGCRYYSGSNKEFFTGWIKDVALIEGEAWGSTEAGQWDDGDALADVVSNPANVAFDYPLDLVWGIRDRSGNEADLTTSTGTPRYSDPAAAPSTPTMEDGIRVRTGISAGNYDTPGPRGASMDDNGRIWVAMADEATDEQVISYSDDNGQTWTDEVVEAFTTVASVSDQQFLVCFQSNGQPMIATIGTYDSTLQVKIWTRSGTDGSPVWTAATSVPSYSGALSTYKESIGRGVLIQHPDDSDYFMLVAADQGSSRAVVKYWISDDGMATWGTGVSLGTEGTDNIQNQIADRRGYTVLTSDSGRNVHPIWMYGGFSGWSGVLHRKISSWDTTPVLGTTTAVQEQSGTNSYINVTGYWNAEDQIVFFAQRATAGAVVQGLYGVIDDPDGTPDYSYVWTGNLSSINDEINCLHPGTGALPSQTMYAKHNTGNAYIIYHDGGRADRDITINDGGGSNLAQENGCTLVGYNQWLDYNRDQPPDLGVISGLGMIVSGRTASTRQGFWYAETADVEYGSGSALPTQVVTTAFVLSNIATVPGNSEIEVSSVLDKASYGGRATARNANGRIYMMGINTSSDQTYVLHSDDNGVTWTSEVIATFACDAHALSIDVDGQPWCAIHKPGQNKIQIYQRNLGGSWHKRINIGTGSATRVESFDIGYDGTLYHLVYGDIRSSNKTRRLRHRTSSAGNLTIWSSATNIDTGDKRDSGPNKFRQLGMMFDRNSDIHVAYGMVDGSRFILRYSKYDESAGTWSTPEDIKDLGSDSNDNFAPHWLSLATDEDDVPHIAYASREPLISNSLRPWYANRIGGTWSTPEQIDTPTEDVLECHALSLSFNQGTVPILAMDVDYKDIDGVLLLGEKPPGGWQFTAIDWDQSPGEYKPDLIYQARSNVSRTRLGVFIEVQGSITVVVSTDLLWDDESEPGEAAATFTQTVNLKGFAYPQTDFEVSDEVGVNRGYERGSEDTVSFGSVVGPLSFDYAREPGGEGIQFQPTIGYTFVPTGGGGDDHYRTVAGNADGGGIHASFSQQIDLIIEKIMRVEHSLTFEDEIHRVIPHTVTTEFEFESDNEASGDRTKSNSDTVTISQVVGLVKELNLGVAHSVTFGESGLVIRDWDALSDHFDPGWTATVESDVGAVRFLYPADLPTQSLTMKKPEFGDIRDDFRRKGSVHRNRSGQARTFKVPVYSEFRLTWHGLLRKRAEEFRVRILEFLGDNLLYVDHNGVQHKCIITDERLTRNQRGPEYVNVQITLEKAQRVDLDAGGAK